MSVREVKHEQVCLKCKNEEKINNKYLQNEFHNFLDHQGTDFDNKKMTTWFWILGWSLSILTVTGNGFIIFLVCSRRQLRTKTNAFVVSLAVADFFVGMTVVPSLFICEITNGCRDRSIRTVASNLPTLFAYASVLNLCSLVLDRYIAVVKPLKYLTFMKGRHVIQMVFFSWVMPIVTETILTLQWFIFRMPILFRILVCLLAICFELLPCLMLIFCFVSMLHVVCQHNRAARSLAKQLRFNHQVLFKTQERSAVIMMGIVIGIFLLCYGIYLRCSLVYIFSYGQKPCNDREFKIPIMVLNSAVNPLAYSFFKRDINKEIKRRI